ncbi:MAG: NADH-quinone oxidoreductase subunit M [Phycisphaeraceae bacterium]|nr:MAG: NADH-quinone oxidoreductase subunit M [Phycisphaeraceae bacterium]
MTLLMLILIPLLGAAVIAFSPERQAKWLCLAWSLIALGAAVYAAFTFNWMERTGAFQFSASWTWIESLGIELSLGADSVSMLLILLTALLAPICALASFTAVQERQKLYYSTMLVLFAAMTGVFAARDLIFFYLCFEFTLAPMYVLISQWGSSNRKAAATKFFLYTFTGSIIALAGLVYIAWKWTQIGDGWSFAISDLEIAASQMSMFEQGWVLLALMVGFAVKVPLFPVHTWLPLAHTEAPTAGSVILAGVLLKLGTYAIYRFVLPFTPLAIQEYAPLIAVLAIIGIIYTGLICWVQRDVKKLVAYSSVSHLGFCVLGLMALNTIGAAGSVMYMVNHGLSTGALFLCIGMMYERYHTRSLDEVGGLASRMPVWAFFMVFFTLASVGLPGLNGFVGEFMCLLGTFQSGAVDFPGGTTGPLGPWYAIAAASGMIIAAIYLLYMVGRIVFGPLREPSDHHAHPVLPTDLNLREIGILAPLAVLCLGLGVYPTPVLRSLEAPINRVGVIAGFHDIEAPGSDETAPAHTLVLVPEEAWP